MAMDFSAIMGAVLYGMDQQQLIIFMIIVQVTSVAGAYVFGLMADRRQWQASAGGLAGADDRCGSLDVLQPVPASASISSAGWRDSR